MKIRELFKTKKDWIQKAAAKTKDGFPVLPKNENAVCWCLKGAIEKCYPEGKWLEIGEKIRMEIQNSIINWNDNENRTFKQVKALVKKLDI